MLCLKLWYSHTAFHLCCSLSLVGFPADAPGHISSNEQVWRNGVNIGFQKHTLNELLSCSSIIISVGKFHFRYLNQTLQESFFSSSTSNDFSTGSLAQTHPFYHQYLFSFSTVSSFSCWHNVVIKTGQKRII